MKNNGSILIVILWVILILSVLAIGFALEMQMEARLQRYQLDSKQAYQIARAGLERAIVELKNDLFLDRKARAFSADGHSDPWANNKFSEKYFNHIELGDGFYTVTVIDELSKLNLNKIGWQTIKRLLQKAGVDEAKAELIANAIIDYRDEDTLFCQDTTIDEDTYYNQYRTAEETTGKALYKLKNGPFESVDELLKVPFMDADLLYSERIPLFDDSYSSGSDKKFTSLYNILTVYGTGQVNLNTASSPVLSAILSTVIPDDEEKIAELVENIIDKRNGFDDEEGTEDDELFAHPGQLTSVKGMELPIVHRLAGQFVVNSDIYTIKSIGEVRKVKKVITVLVKRSWIQRPLTEEEKEEYEGKNLVEGVNISILRWLES